MRRACRILLACTLLACTAGAAKAAPGLLVGVADDTLKWGSTPQSKTALVSARDLGLRAVRVTVPWQPGHTQLGVAERGPVDRMILATWGAGLRVVLAVYGRADAAPQTDAQQDDYCTFVASLLRRYPGVSDVVIWNEPNSGRFWRPQFAPDGTSVAPAAYEALLARCWDVLHTVRPGVNVIAASAPRGGDKPRASGNGSHSPVNFYRKLGDAYRSSGRRLPILDTIGHNPYPVANSERPWAKHPGTTIGEGDYDKLMEVLTEAFGGTAQPLPGQSRVAIWYMEQGFQTVVDPAKSGLYHGEETDKQALPPSLGAAAGATVDGPAPDQATQLGDALRLAYCQPGVAAFFNFELIDETDLGGWQSGLLWADGTPKPSYQSFKQAVRSVAARNVNCDRYAKAAEAASELGFTTGSEPKGKDGKPGTPVVVK